MINVAPQRFAVQEWLRATARSLIVRPHSLVRDVSVAAAFLLAAIIGNFLKELVLPGHMAFSPFFPALLGVAVLCRWHVTIGFVIVSAFLGAYFWGSNASDYIRTEAAFIYAVFAVIVVALAEGLKDAYGQIALREKQLSTVNRELAHRIKNLFQIANVIVSQSIRTVSVSKDVQHTIAGRLRALGAAQTISQLGDDDVSLAHLAQVTLGPLAPEPNRLLANGPPTTIPAKATTMLALVLHELGTNALKYGAWSNQKGIVRVQWKQSLAKLTLSWTEHEGPFVVAPTRVGAGSKLIRNALSDAVVDFRLEPDGAKCRIEYNDERFRADAEDRCQVN